MIPDFVVPLQSSGSGILASLLPLAFVIVIFAGLWKMFEKAGEPGWAAIIPIYNIYVLVKVSGNAWWWLLLFFIPLVNIIAQIKISIDIAKRFGEGVLFGIGVLLLPFIFYPLLGFGDYRYEAP